MRAPEGVIGESILALTGLIQTIPSLALLALLVPIPFLGISPVTAVIALFLVWVIADSEEYSHWLARYLSPDS